MTGPKKDETQQRLCKGNKDSVRAAKLYLQVVTSLENAFFNSLYKVATEVEQFELSQAMKLAG
jgi:hypothetical protein